MASPMSTSTSAALRQELLSLTAASHLGDNTGPLTCSRLRSPKHVRSRAKGDLVDDVIDVLSLRTVQHSVVGSVEKRGIR